MCAYVNQICNGGQADPCRFLLPKYSTANQKKSFNPSKRNNAVRADEDMETQTFLFLIQSGFNQSALNHLMDFYGM